MKKTKTILTSLIAACTLIPILTGCNKDPKQEKIEFTFSIDLDSGKNQLEIGDRDVISVYDVTDPTDTTVRNYTYTSSNPLVATINSFGTIEAVGEGQVNFQVKETASGKTATLVNPINIVKQSSIANGGFNFSSQTADNLPNRTEILGKLEKYAMDSHLTGITLFDNGGYVKYRERVDLPTTEYITGYGFGLLREGNITEDLEKEVNQAYKRFYHASIAQDSHTINAMNESGSQVSDLASYITQSYWGTKMGEDKKSYDWYPILAADKVQAPIVDDAGNITGYKAEDDNKRPIPMEKENDLKLYKKWRIYLRDGLKYSFTGNGNINDKDKSKNFNPADFDGRAIALEDYEFVYQFLLTGKNSQSRGVEMAGDLTYGIKGASKFLNSTLNSTDQTQIDTLWNTMKSQGKLGINTGVDDNGKKYIDLELINPIDEFTAMYTLSSSLVSPLPREFIEKIGEGSIIDGAQKYGNFNSGSILNYTISVGPYKLSEWIKDQLIVFSRNDNWFEVNDTDTYRIKGIHNRVVPTDTDTEAAYKQFTDGALDVCGIPTSKIEYEAKQPRVYKTKGDSTFKLNVNSCTQEEWDKLFGPNGTIKKNCKWTVKPWMSNNNFLNGLFYSINRAEFARKRGVQPSINYFSDAYLSDPENGISYNSTDAHKKAVEAYHTVEYEADGKTEKFNDYGYNFDKAVNSFRAAVNQLTKEGKIQKGTRNDPRVISIEICWMYPTDPSEYGIDIKNYFETAFNNEAVSGGTVKLDVKNTFVTQWEDVYNERMMKGQFDLGFGAISGNTYNPLNFMEVLKSDNSSQFTLNWGTDTSVVDPIHPITFEADVDGTKQTLKFSYDGLWEVADHGGIIKNGASVKPVVECYSKLPRMRVNGSTTITEINDLSGTNENGVALPNFDGYQVQIPLEFVQTEGVTIDFSRLELTTVSGTYSITDATYNPDSKVLTAIVPKELCNEIDNDMFTSLYYDKGIDFTKPEEKWKQHPFRQDKLSVLWDYEIYFTTTLASGDVTENSVTAKLTSRSEN